MYSVMISVHVSNTNYVQQTKQSLVSNEKDGRILKHFKWYKIRRTHRVGKCYKIEIIFGHVFSEMNSALLMKDDRAEGKMIYMVELFFNISTMLQIAFT